MTRETCKGRYRDQSQRKITNRQCTMPQLLLWELKINEKSITVSELTEMSFLIV